MADTTTKAANKPRTSQSGPLSGFLLLKNDVILFIYFNYRSPISPKNRINVNTKADYIMADTSSLRCGKIVLPD